MEQLLQAVIYGWHFIAALFGVVIWIVRRHAKLDGEIELLKEKQRSLSSDTVKAITGLTTRIESLSRDLNQMIGAKREQDQTSNRQHGHHPHAHAQQPPNPHRR